MTNRMIYKICFIVLLFSCHISYNQYIREIGLFFDFNNNIMEPLYKKELDIIVSEFVLALAEEKTPLLVSPSILSFFLKRKSDVKKKLKKKSSKQSQVVKFYKQIHKKKETLLKNTEKSTSILHEKLSNELANKKTKLGSLKEKINKHYSKTKQNLSCYLIPFNDENFKLYYHKELNLYLIIPIKYKKKCQQELNNVPKPKIYDNHLKRPLYSNEIILGLKYRNLEKQKIKNINMSLKKGYCTTAHFADIFLNKHDIDHEQHFAILPSWIIYLDGHGRRAKNFPHSLNTFDTIKTLRKKLGVRQFPLTKDQVKKNPKKNIKSLEKLYAKEQTILNAVHNSQASIASLPLLEFRQFLHFLQNDIFTHVFCFDSCYTSGKNLDIIFKLFPQTSYSFPIISCTIDETQSTGFSFPHIHIKKNNALQIGDTPAYLQNNAFYDKHHFSLHMFTKNIRNGHPWITCLSSIKHFHTTKNFKSRIHNLPQIMLADSAKFLPPYKKQHIAHVNKITLSFKQTNNLIKYKRPKTDIIVFEEAYIPISLLIKTKGKRLPFFLSKNFHPLKETPFYVSNLILPRNALSSLIKACTLLGALKSERIFCFRNLICLDDTPQATEENKPKLFEYVSIVHKTKYLNKKDTSSTSLYFFKNNQGYQWQKNEKKPRKLTPKEAFGHAVLFNQCKRLCKKRTTLYSTSFEKELPAIIRKKQTLQNHRSKNCKNTLCKKNQPCLPCYYRK